MENQECEWMPIKGYESLYDISREGKIRTHRRQGTDNRILKTSINRNGYEMVALCKNSKYKTYCVHRLLAEAFIPNPDNYPMINHKDECKANNTLDNLEWCTCAYNNSYGTARERASSTRYKPCKGTWPDGTEKIYNSCTLASKDTGISQGNIWGCCNGLWKHAGGAIWKYV